MFQLKRFLIAALFIIFLLPCLVHAQIEIAWPNDTDDLIIKAAYIRGTVNGFPFLYYTLDYKHVDDIVYTPIDTFYSAVDDDLLGKWDTHALDEDYYDLRLNVHFSTTYSYAVYTEVHVTPNEGDNFKFIGFSGDYSCIANYCDLDKDGEWEIVYGTSSKLLMLSNDGELEQNLDLGKYSRPVAVGNLDDDGYDDIVAIKHCDSKTDYSGDTLVVFCSGSSSFEYTVTNFSLRSVWEFEQKFNLPIMADIDGDVDNFDEIFFRGKDENYTRYVIKCKVTLDPVTLQHTVNTSYVEGTAFLPLDHDGDGNVSLFVLDGNVIKEYDDDFGLVDTYLPEDYNGNTINSGRTGIFSAYDVCGSELPELIFLAHISTPPDSGYYMWALDDNLDSIWCRYTTIRDTTYVPLDIPATFEKYVCHPVFADIDDDGSLEYFIGSYDRNYGYVYAFDSAGEPYNSQSAEFVRTPFYGSASQPLIADIDGDYNLDVLISSCNSHAGGNPGQRIIAWDRQGNMLDDFPIEVDIVDRRDWMFTPTIFDKDQDGDLDLVLPLRQGIFLMSFEDVWFDKFLTPVSMYRYHRDFDSYGPSYNYDTTVYYCGDVNTDFSLDDNDVDFLYDYIFNSGRTPLPLASGNVNGDGSVNVSDYLYLRNYVFNSGPDLDCAPVTSKSVVKHKQVGIQSSLKDGNTIITLSSPIELGAMELIFENTIRSDLVNLANKGIEIIKTTDSNKIAFIDSDGISNIKNGDYDILEIPGDYYLLSAKAYDQAGWEYPVVFKDFSSSNLPKEFSLGHNYPNPFNPSTSLSYSLPKETHVNISIYNVLGQKVVELVDKTLPAGNHKVVWNGNDSNDKTVSSGVYFAKMKAGDYVESRKMVMMK
jgi:Secretion system C-terminal sorting domain/Dockerin type I domain